MRWEYTPSNGNSIPYTVLCVSTITTRALAAPKRSQCGEITLMGGHWDAVDPQTKVFCRAAGSTAFWYGCPVGATPLLERREIGGHCGLSRSGSGKLFNGRNSVGPGDKEL